MEVNKNKTPKPNPRLNSNFLSALVFWWVNPFMSVGAKKDLEVNDLYDVMPGDNSEELGRKLQREWDNQIAKCKRDANKQKKTKPSLTKALVRTFGLKFLLVGLLAFLEECVFKIGQPLCLGQLVHYFGSENKTISTTQAYLYATGVMLGSGLYTFTHHPYFFSCQHTGMQIRVAACSLVYKKCLLLSQKALGQTTIGQMVNIMSNDVNRYDFSVIFLHYLWVGPLQTLISMVILLHVIGPSCLVGLAVLILFVPLQSWMGKVFSKLRLETAKRTNERIRTMNEIISAMRVIKMYTWEKPFAKLIAKCRRKEINVIRRTNYFRALNMSLFFTSSKLIIFLTFLVFIFTGNHLTAQKVFVTVSLFNNIRLIMTLFFPGAITMAAEARVSTKRIENFLLLDEVEKNAEAKVRPAISECLIELNQLTVKWPAAGDKEDNTLTDISFNVRPGQVFAVVGQVGSGKSSLLNVLLGELSPSTGTCRVAGKVAYASQESWIFSGTVRQNILCGLEYDLKRYKKVIKACALDKDFSLFPNGDQTAVGERGVSLSGGQKARVNLARSLYVDADIYLMDDPLSAVDTHVGRHLFDKAINGYLRDKIRVLVTHQLQYLKDVDQIVIIKAGRVEAMGSYKEISNSGFDIAKTIEEEEPELEEDNLTRSFSECEITVRFQGVGLFRTQYGSVWDLSHQEEKPTFAEETRSSGSVSAKVYWEYFRSGGSCLSLLTITITCVFTQVLFSGSDYWLTLWTNAEEQRAANRNISENSTYVSVTENGFFNVSSVTEEIAIFSGAWWKDPDTYTGIYVFTILIICVFIFSLIRTIHYFMMCMISSINLHNRMFQSVIRTPLLFFDQNPVGRVLNRFAKDIGCVDEMLPSAFFDVITIALTAVGILFLVGLVNPWLLLPILFLSIIFVNLRQFYLKTARDVKRLEATTRSPVFTHLSSSLVGLTTLRAHQCEGIFQNIFDECQDVHSSAWYMFLSTTRWFGIWLDWICVIYVGCVTYACLALRDSMTGSEAGLAISSAMALTGMFQWGVRQSAEVENQMTSVERVIDYSRLPSEAPLDSAPGKKPPDTWPLSGAIQFDGMSLRYIEADQPVLKNITCLIRANEKIGIVGRTGAGKSSLIAALFRLAEPDGRIIIDGVDSKSIGLHDLRSKIAIIPQDPVLFSGSLRKNLDPFGLYSDDALWNALEGAKLKETVKDLSAGLEANMTEGGANFSVGQRQLICLARAILRQNRILVLDEATANVDQKTDSLIQLTIRERFRDCTVLTIAHRLNTIMDSDRIMLLDAGYLKEFGEPAVLLENPKSMFYSLVEQTGPIVATQLTELAKQAAEQRRGGVKNKTDLTMETNGNTIRHQLCPKASQEQGLDESDFETEKLKIENCDVHLLSKSS
ncbi:LOW QUALITY PROTEIN: ATP-binding cassette sub-family C member 4-like [Daphnia carinata]|uniref:LOW QUALITY PROTEIN: ATP-binding cassette sub-family C member 4-like n=1 Tax=Daphnia carinata TaxID=120202 RepID=UPI00257CE415|nr:LOW QUALITY PROTEIN: ATP-binding cassette sub-family C member 4-like [Daphnia carinata]